MQPQRPAWAAAPWRRAAAIGLRTLSGLPLLLALAMVVFAVALPPAAMARGDAPPAQGAGAKLPQVAVAELPPEARATLALIRAGGPFPYERDGIVFNNREKLLPLRPRGWYREYTVKTPGVRTRGARRIVAAKSGEFYYTEDHYASFRQIRE